MRIQNKLIVTIALISCFAFVGCGESNRPSPIIKPAYSVTVDQLASRLGLTIQKNGVPYYEMTNANNRVLLFPHENGRIYVNGKAICPVGKITTFNSSAYVSELLVPKIRGYLISSYTAPTAPDTTAHIASGTVVVDAGHGGHDPGATSYTGYYEKGVNLSVARKLASLLESRGVNVIMTRNNDTFVELNERAAIANRAGADLFVSIHCDSHPKRSQNGYTLYVAPSAKWATKKIAIAVEQAMGQTGLSSVGIRNRDLRVLVRTKCPAILVECGYLTNPNEANLLNDNNFQNRIANAIADGIIKSL